MSQENVQLMRESLAYLLAGSDSDIEIVEPTALPGSRTYRGHQGLLDALDHWAGAWGEFRVDVERIIGVGDQVVSLTHHRVRWTLSGAPVEVRVGYVYTIKNGKLVRWEMFATWDEALEAAGLRK